MKAQDVIYVDPPVKKQLLQKKIDLNKKRINDVIVYYLEKDKQ